MTTASSITPSARHQHDMLLGIVRRAIQIAVALLVQAALLFLGSGHFVWVWAWVLLGISLISIAVNSAFMLHSSLETIAERGSATLTHTWDKLLSLCWAVFQYLALPLTAALDLRFGWTAGMSLALHLVGALLYAIGLALFGWAMITNAYFSTAVRIQSERGHTVCRSGPYRIVRHPGYSGVLLQSLGMPLLLGSWWALIPGLLAAASINARTAFEDRTLQLELPGYTEFTSDVHYRLIPGVW